MTTNMISAFNFDSQTVRIVERGNEPWFVANDVCAILDIANSRRAIAELDPDEKGVQTLNTLGGPQAFSIISESGLYVLIMRSRKPEARRFRKWVTAELLPSLRRTGQLPQQQPAAKLLPPPARPGPLFHGVTLSTASRSTVRRALRHFYPLFGKILRWMYIGLSNAEVRTLTRNAYSEQQLARIRTLLIDLGELPRPATTVSTRRPAGQAQTQAQGQAQTQVVTHG